MQLGGAALIVEPECPVHARQGWQQRAVHELEFVRKRGETGVAPRSLVFSHKIEEKTFEQFGIEHSLRLGKTAKTHITYTDFVLDTLQMTCRAKDA